MNGGHRYESTTYKGKVYVLKIYFDEFMRGI